MNVKMPGPSTAHARDNVNNDSARSDRSGPPYSAIFLDKPRRDRLQRDIGHQKTPFSTRL